MENLLETITGAAVIALYFIYVLSRGSPKKGGRTPIDPQLRWAIYKRDGYACAYCGGDDQLELDHIQPVSQGGEDTWENLVTSCRTCNASKGARTPGQWLGGFRE